MSWRFALFVTLILSSTYAVAAGAEDRASEPLEPRHRVVTHVQRAFGPEALAEAVVSAGIGQLSSTPESWAQTWGGYGRRVASSLGTGAMDEGIQLAVGAALDHDTRYVRKGEGGLLRRSGHAALSVVIARDRTGCRVPAWSRFAGAGGAAAVSSLWYPEERGAGRYIAGQSVAMLGGDLFANLWDEFGPDLRHRLLGR